jgi:DNA-binding MarR family transcriptional regulator
MSTRGTGPAGPDATLGMVAADEDNGLQRFLRCGHILGSLFREILEESYLSQRCTHPLTRTQFCLLKLVTLNAELLPSEVARYLGVTPAAITKNVDKLEDLGLVRRDPSSEDRRATVLSVRPEGRRVVREYEDLKASRMAPIVDSLDDEELDELCDLLEGLCVDLLQHGPTRSGSCMRCAGYYSTECLLGVVQGDCALRPHSRADEEELA